jgi:hypothetical protein
MHVARWRETAAGASLLAAGVLYAATAGLAAAPQKPVPTKSSELWATVNLCNTPHHPDTIGIRGSMPGDGHARDRMYMRFLVQNLNESKHTWAPIGRSADSGFVLVGSGALTRQAGRSFEFKPTVTTVTLRGLVEFQWHHDGHTTRSVTLPTSEGHTSLAGAEPAGFSAATCALP